MTRLICDGQELAGAQIFVGEDPVDWVREIEFSNNPFRRTHGRMLIDHRGRETFLRKYQLGVLDTFVFTVRRPSTNEPPLLLQVWPGNFSPVNPEYPFIGIVLPPH